MAQPLLTVVAPTCGRPTLERMLASIRRQALPSDVEILVVGDTFNGDFHGALAAAEVTCRTWDARYLAHDGGRHVVGQPQRQEGMRHARGRWLAFLQDDSWWTTGAWRSLRARLTEGHYEPRLFRVRVQWGFTVWQAPCVQLGNCDADGIVVPNEPDKLGTWKHVYEGDFWFLASTVELWDGRIHYEHPLIAEAESIVVRRARQ